MENLKIQNTREVKKLHELLKSQFGFDGQLEYAFLINNQNRIYVVNKEVAQINMKSLRINSVGLYFGELRDNKLRLSIEGSQIIGPSAKNNVLTLNEKQAKDWLKGFDLDIEAKDQEFFILKHGDDFLGCGKSAKSRIFNFVPKNRRVKTSD
jgi:NOL1/NOP2/fmu family ribosome biogenesis protein